MALPSKAEPNLTPMLDMVFQLITFFMLVINFKTNQIDRQLDLPVVGTARPVDTHGELSMMMININNLGKYTVYNKPFSAPEMEQYIQRQAELDRLSARRANRSFDDADDLPTIVVIRADRNTPFDKLSRILKICQDNHYRNFAFRALGKKPKA
ncbi:MAG TPA: biopolymer transporter ExbD [Pirellulales bacterium]|jgi:biopolymer transport protein ExbD|nr:biopolymer transporter ExbD [Pirellulales bacterium]